MNIRAQLPDIHHLSESAILAEQAFLGACIMSHDAFATAAALVEADQLSDPVHTQLWTAMHELAADGRPISVPTLISKLGNPKIAGDLTLSVYLARCVSETSCPAAYVADYAKQIREYWACRELIASADDLRSGAAQPGADPRTILSDLMQQADETRVRLDPRRSGFRSISAVNASVIDRMTSKMQGDVTESAVTTGLGDLDKLLGGGFRPGELIVLAGRPGMGKTTAAVSMARMACKGGHAGAFFSLEMMRDQIGARMISDECYDHRRPIPAGRILAGELTDAEAERVVLASRAVDLLPLEVDDSSALSVGEISARARSLATRFARQHRRLEHIWIDYLKFVRASDRYRGQRHYEVGEITAGLKSLAKDLNCAIILLAQINRGVESREDKRPTLADLRESGDIEADADVVMFLYRDIYYLQSRQPDPGTHEHGEWAIACEKAENKLEAIVAKQRIGKVGRQEVFCDVACSALRNLERVHGAD